MNIHIMNKTPLIDLHKEIGASIGDFAGWKMPIDYGNMLDEALTTRKNVSFFDISHLSRFLVSGEDIFPYLQKLLARDIKKLEINKMSGPTAFLNNNAGFKDDVMLYRISNNASLIVGNAINHDKILDWLHTHSSDFKIKINDITFNTVMLAIQGPKSKDIMHRKIGEHITKLAPLSFISEIKTVYGLAKLISYSGWTGEPGYEIITDIDIGEKIIYDLYNNEKIIPAGLGARDILRIEMGYCLYGNEIDENINPIEAKYWVFSWKKKENFIGKDKLFEIIKNGVDKIRNGILIKKGSPLPRTGMKIYVQDKEIGVITSGTYSPWLKAPIALGYIFSRYSITGLKVKVQTEKREIEGKIVEPPFIK